MRPTGSVEGVTGHRRRSPGKLPLALPLDDSVQISPSDTETSKAWLLVDQEVQLFPAAWSQLP